MVVAGIALTKARRVGTDLVTAVFPMRSDDVDTGVAWHYGDPLGEQRRLLAGVGAVDLSHRGVFSVSGPDRLTWLDSLTSQLLLGVESGQSAYNLLLDPHGRVESEMHIAALDAELLISVEPGNVASVVAFLDRMRFMLRVEVRDVSSEWACYWEPVRDAHHAFPSVLTPAVYAGLPLGDVGADVSRYLQAERDTFVGREVFVPKSELSNFVASQEALAGTWAWNALRVAAGVPRYGVETDAKTIPHEVGWLGTAVHMRKGCYRGQETVARTFNMGKPPRRLVLLHLDGSQDNLPAHGTAIELDGRQIGFLGMAVQHHELGPIASALVKRNVDVEATLQCAGMAASQQVIVSA